MLSRRLTRAISWLRQAGGRAPGVGPIFRPGPSGGGRLARPKSSISQEISSRVCARYARWAGPQADACDETATAPKISEQTAKLPSLARTWASRGPRWGRLLAHRWPGLAVVVHPGLSGTPRGWHRVAGVQGGVRLHQTPSVLCVTDSFGREHAWWVAIAARGADTYRSTRAERIMNKLTTWVTVTASPNTLAGLMKGGSGDY